MTRLLALLVGAVAGYLMGYRIADRDRLVVRPPIVRPSIVPEPEIQMDPRLWHAQPRFRGTLNGGSIQ